MLAMATIYRVNFMRKMGKDVSPSPMSTILSQISFVCRSTSPLFKNAIIANISHGSHFYYIGIAQHPNITLSKKILNRLIFNFIIDYWCSNYK